MSEAHIHMDNKTHGSMQPEIWRHDFSSVNKKVLATKDSQYHMSSSASSALSHGGKITLYKIIVIKQICPTTRAQCTSASEVNRPYKSTSSFST